MISLSPYRIRVFMYMQARLCRCGVDLYHIIAPFLHHGTVVHFEGRINLFDALRVHI